MVCISSEAFALQKDGKGSWYLFDSSDCFRVRKSYDQVYNVCKNREARLPDNAILFQFANLSLCACCHVTLELADLSHREIPSLVMKA